MSSVRSHALYRRSCSALSPRLINGPEVSLGPDKRQGANSSFLAQVMDGRWVRLTDPLNF